jgi:hypothetical protein
MRLPIKTHALRYCCLPFLSGLAVVLTAAAFDPDQNWARLRALPNGRRAKLVENLNKFDLLYSRLQQDSLRELDRKIHELPAESRAHHLSVLNRYHNWLNQLPEAKQDELSALPAAERMASVRKLAADYPPGSTMTAQFVRQVDVGEYSPVELASLFRIWQAMSPAKRGEVERLPAVQKRHDVMYKAAEARDIPDETKPLDIDEEKSTSRFEEFARRHRLAYLVSEVRKMAEAGKSTEARTKKAAVQGEVLRDIVRRQAINNYFVDHPPKAVTLERLSEFLAAFPPWLQSAFDPYSPEEAQRRLTIVYRLVFPAPSEFSKSQRSSAAAVPTPPVAREPVRSTRPSGKPSPRTGNPPL